MRRLSIIHVHMYVIHCLFHATTAYCRNFTLHFRFQFECLEKIQSATSAHVVIVIGTRALSFFESTSAIHVMYWMLQ